MGADGRVYAATSPDGKVYRLGTTAADAVVVFDAAGTAEKPKYLWDVAEARNGDLYVAAGAPAVVYRVPAGGGKAEVAFKTCGPAYSLLADGGGWEALGGERWERCDLSLRHAGEGCEAVCGVFGGEEGDYRAGDGWCGECVCGGSGNAAGCWGGDAGASSAAGDGCVGGDGHVFAGGIGECCDGEYVIPEGSEIYRIAADGSPARLLALKEDVVYALAWHDGRLLAATGNRGRVYRVDTDVAGRFTDVAHLEAAQGMAFAAGGAGGPLLVGTSNSGKVYRLEQKAAANATYTSEVFDAQGFAQWGRVEVEPEECCGVRACLCGRGMWRAR